jgi:hypothetical protein
VCDVVVTNVGTIGGGMDRAARVMDRPRQSGAAYGYTEGQAGVADVARSADVIVPMVMARFAPARVVDLGCGAGDWLAAFLRHGAREVQGYDGPWVPASSLRIPETAFAAIDFHTALPSTSRCDLAMSPGWPSTWIGDGARCVSFCAGRPTSCCFRRRSGQGGHGTSPSSTGPLDQRSSRRGEGARSISSGRRSGWMRAP